MRIRRPIDECHVAIFLCLFRWNAQCFAYTRWPYWSYSTSTEVIVQRGCDVEPDEMRFFVIHLIIRVMLFALSALKFWQEQFTCYSCLKPSYHDGTLISSSAVQRFFLARLKFRQLCRLAEWKATYRALADLWRTNKRWNYSLETLRAKISGRLPGSSALQRWLYCRQYHLRQPIGFSLSQKQADETKRPIRYW